MPSIMDSSQPIGKPLQEFSLRKQRGEEIAEPEVGSSIMVGGAVESGLPSS